MEKSKRKEAASNRNVTFTVITEKSPRQHEEAEKVFEKNIVAMETKSN